ncbi:unnamed protein product [Arctogadus glacialis]
MNLGWVLGKATMNLLALLLILPTAHAQLGPLNLNSSGLEFLVAFPENIAHYHPIGSRRNIDIFSMEDNTVVTYESRGVEMVGNMMKNDRILVYIDESKELRRKQTSNSTIKIKSNKPVIVRTINGKDQSIQTSLLKANDKLGKVYKIPPTPSTITELRAESSEVPEKAPFTVVVINTGAANDVQWKGDGDRRVSLAPFQLAQFWMSNVAAEYEVDATDPVSVLFGHPCFTIFNCTCGMMVTPLDPESATELNYFIPPDFMTGSEKQAVLLVAGNRSPLPYDPDHPTVQSVGSVLFHIPGLLLNILPEEEFAACFHIQGNTYLGSIPRFAIVVVHNDHKDLVHHGPIPLDAPVWSPILTTHYVSTRVPLDHEKHVFWHPKSMIAVYELGTNETTLFGNPAPIISKSTSLKGCVLDPELVNIGVKEMGWVESITFCRDLGLELAAMDGVELRFLAPKLHAMNKTLEQVWIGYRRSSLMGDWYRLNKKEVLVTHWGKGEPGGEEEGQCAMMSLDPSKDFGWSDESCCTSAVPLCYKPPKLLIELQEFLNSG